MRETEQPAESDEEGLETKLGRIRELLSGTSGEEYAGAYQRLRIAHSIFLKLVADHLAGPLNAYWRAESPSGLDGRIALANQINSHLQQLGLAIEDEKSGQPCYLRVESHAHCHNKCRYQLNVLGSKRRPRSSVEPFNLTLTQREEDGIPTRWCHRVVPDNSREVGTLGRF